MKRVAVVVLTLAIGPPSARPVRGQEQTAHPPRPTALGEQRDAGAATRVLLEQESLYHYLRVTEHGPVRRLQFRRSGDEYEESAINVANPLEFEMGYYPLMLAAFAHQPAPRSILFIGLGGGTLPSAIHHYFPAAQIDTVELDPAVAAVAKDYFGFKEDARMKVYIRDYQRAGPILTDDYAPTDLLRSIPRD